MNSTAKRKKTLREDGCNAERMNSVRYSGCGAISEIAEDEWHHLIRWCDIADKSIDCVRVGNRELKAAFLCKFLSAMSTSNAGVAVDLRNDRSYGSGRPSSASNPSAGLVAVIGHTQRWK